MRPPPLETVTWLTIAGALASAVWLSVVLPSPQEPRQLDAPSSTREAARARDAAERRREAASPAAERRP